jgi:hypothetical protein
LQRYGGKIYISEPYSLSQCGILCYEFISGNTFEMLSFTTSLKISNLALNPTPSTSCVLGHCHLNY